MNKQSPAREIAVLMTCHNRRATTLRGLRNLFSQTLPEGFALEVVLTDDGSTDGTGDAVRQEFPEVNVLLGDGNLFWAGGTQLAWDAARPAEFYLWLNDDVALRPNALKVLLETYQAAGDRMTIVVGSTCDPQLGKTCTGGMERKGWYDVRVIDPREVTQPCDTFNGNIVLIPSVVEERIGSLDEAYTHFFADGDYGLRARKQDVAVLLAPGHLGECSLNPIANSSFDGSLSISERWKRMLGPKGYRPPRQWWAFVRAHAPRPKVFYWAVPYLLFFLESLSHGRLRLRRNVQRPMKVS